MIYPSDFYEITTGSEVIYRDQPPGELNIDELLQSKPCWGLGNKEQQRPKKLIITDWSIQFLRQAKLSNFCNSLMILMNNGFNLYLWQDGDIVRLSANSLASIEEKKIRRKITLVDPKNIIDKLQQQFRMNKREILLLDHYWVQQLMTGFKHIEEHVLVFSDYNSLTSNEKDQFLPIFQNAPHPFTSIIHNEFNYLDNHCFNQLISYFPQTKRTINYQKLSDLEEKEITQLVLNGEITIHNHQIRLTDLITLKKWSIGDFTFRQQSFDYLLKLACNLQTLHLHRCQIDETTFIPPDLAHLRSLKIEESHLSNGKLQQLLVSAGRIEKLNLFGFEFDPTTVLASFNLTSLKTLNLSRSTITPSKLLVFLQAAPLLTHLQLDGCKHLKNSHSLDDNFFNSFSLTYLKKLSAPYASLDKQLVYMLISGGNLEQVSFSGTKIDSNQLNLLINLNRNLQELDLTNCTDLSGELIINNPLFALKKLRLSSTNLSLESLENLLNAVPFCEELELAEIGAENIQVKTFPKLRELNLYASCSDIRTVHQFWSICPTIQKLSLSLNEFISDYPIMKYEENWSLLELDLSKTTVTAENFHLLANSFPNLQKLDLSNFVLVDDLHLQPNTWPNLKELNLTANSLSTDNYQNLFAAAPNLEILIIDQSNIDAFASYYLAENLKQLKQLSYRDIGQKIIFFKEDQLAHLEQLRASINNAQEEIIINTLLTAAPHLKLLDLSFCANVQVPTLHLPRLTHLNVRSSEFTAKNLSKLLQCAPKLQEVNILNMANLVIDDDLLYFLSLIPEVIPLNYRENYSYQNLSALPSQTQNNPIELPPPMDDLAVLRNLRPPSEEYTHQFNGRNRTKSQEMIIDKLLQYFAITNQSFPFISQLSSGICHCLCSLYNHMELNYWLKFVDEVANWNGKLDTLNDFLDNSFILLTQYIIEYNSLTKPPYFYFLGENFPTYLANTNGKYRLANIWHSVMVTRLASNSWCFYDPNSPSGVISVNDYAYLLQLIKFTLGDLVLIEDLSPQLPLKINDIDYFFIYGGLFILLNAYNRAEILEEITPLPSLSKEALAGLLLRNTKGRPAWTQAFFITEFTNDVGIIVPFLATVYRLIQQFMNAFVDAASQLQDSVEVLSVEQKELLIQQFLRFAPHDDLTDILIAILEASPLSQAEYEKEFKVWVDQKSNATTKNKFLQEMIKPSEKKNRLIRISSDGITSGEEKTANLQLWLAAFCKSKAIPCYIADSPSDLVCLAPTIKYNAMSNEGILQNDGPSGKCYQFIKSLEQEQQAAVFIINYNNFYLPNNEPIVQFNTIINEKYHERHIENFSLPENAIVIGLQDIDNPSYYNEADFTTRFQQIIHCPLHDNQVLLPELVVEEVDEFAADEQVIDLNYGLDWKKQLIGHWQIQGSKFHFQPGSLIDALSQNSFINIKNAPWEDSHFRRFWHYIEALGRVDTPIRSYTFPYAPQIRTITKINWSELAGFITYDRQLSPTSSAVLNPAHLIQFFTNYHVDDELGFISLDGLISNAKLQILEINVTRELSSLDWLRIFASAAKYQTHLHLHLAPYVFLPPELPLNQNYEEVNGELPSASHTEVIISTDVDTSLAEITARGDWIIINVDDCSASNLIKKIDATLDQSVPCFVFSTSDCAVSYHLEQNEKVALFGLFSEQLVDELAPFLLNRLFDTKSPGHLVLINGKSNFNYCRTKFDNPNSERKLKCLGELPLYIKNHLEQLLNQSNRMSLSELCARKNYLLANPNSESSDDAWQGLESISVANLEFEPLNLSTCEEEAEKFEQDRLSSLFTVWQHSPLVVGTGMSGGGKSTLARKLENTYWGFKEIPKWAMDGSPSIKILVIDEANLFPRMHSLFEALFTNSPGICFEGIYYPLSLGHKVLFLVNPTELGDERQLSLFMLRHGSVIVFDPLPFSVLYVKVLQPLFKDTLLEHFSYDISVHLLAIYAYLCRFSTFELLISPRELLTMALLILSYMERHPQANLAQVTIHFSYKLAIHLVPEKNRLLFDKKFKPTVPIVPEQVEDPTDNFCFTHSRLEVAQEIINFIYLKELRRKNAERWGDDKLYGGLGGIVLEGEPGIGKSELIVALLHAMSYQEIQEEAVRDKGFCRIPASMSLTQKEKILRESFLQEQNVINFIDEINSSPLMEPLLNHLLMGSTPENEKPTNPGFMVIGAQNPGRRNFSTALSRRLLCIKIDEYSEQEIKEILKAKKLPQKAVNAIAAAFIKQRNFAKENNLSPLPNFHNLIVLALNEAERLLVSPLKKPTHVSGRVSQFSIFEPAPSCYRHQAPNPRI